MLPPREAQERAVVAPNPLESRRGPGGARAHATRIRQSAERETGPMRSADSATNRCLAQPAAPAPASLSDPSAE